MLQVFLAPAAAGEVHFENEDALPVSDRLIKEIEARFPPKSVEEGRASLPAAEMLEFLHKFYERFELSVPQRRIFQRAEKILNTAAPTALFRLAVADVSGKRNRRFSKKS